MSRLPSKEGTQLRYTDRAVKLSTVTEFGGSGLSMDNKRRQSEFANIAVLESAQYLQPSGW